MYAVWYCPKNEEQRIRDKVYRQNTLLHKNVQIPFVYPWANHSVYLNNGKLAHHMQLNHKLN